MAGSYDHIRGSTGEFRFDLVENLGDAWETCEMCFWMINHLAGGDQKKISDAKKAYYRRDSKML